MVEVVRRKQRHGGHAAKAEQPKQSAPFQGGPTLQTVAGGELPPLISTLIGRPCRDERGKYPL